MTPMIAFFFDVEWGKMILLIGGSLLVTAIIVGGGGWFALKALASYLNHRRDTWEATAAELGLTIDRTSPAIAKPLTGQYKDHEIKIVSFSVRRSKNSSENHISCEVFYAKPFNFPFSIKSRDRFIQEFTSVFAGYDIQIGLASFDNAFHVDSESPDSLHKLLTYEPQAGLRPTVLTDLVLIRNRNESVEAGDFSVKVTVKAEVEQIDLIRTALNEATALAVQFQAAYLSFNS